MADKGTEEVHTEFWWGELRERDDLENLGVDDLLDTVNTQQMQRPELLVQMHYIWRHVSAVKRPSSGQKGIVLLGYSQIVCPMESHCLHLNWKSYEVLNYG